jgi:hypothetical protein
VRCEPVSLNLTKAIERSNPTTSRGAGSSSHTQFLANGARIVIVDINAEAGEKAAKELDADSCAWI